MNMTERLAEIEDDVKWYADHSDADPLNPAEVMWLINRVRALETAIDAFTNADVAAISKAMVMCHARGRDASGLGRVLEAIGAARRAVSESEP